ncbi:methylated-DNA--[protein]-cysteine S-methyltransferase [Stieleria sp. JC731]|uniref:methylated-DNA--[protein]-cysteine S-methyltransferase n=1 Tax=Pirellulaceae TaxID=2691357 RepID=UPI001E450ED3|nr:methylated-DNA--[protein]-cysteine S-methyltransferase [Stieleria sp. JC731]MCC9599446.1 methylated-DNA--[protein]-cysteine S-methyltransferase [Stieleria sp. JC731]
MISLDHPKVLRDVAYRTYRHDSPLGQMRSVWTQAGLYSLLWESEADFTAEVLPADEDEMATDLDQRLSRYFATGQSDFGSIAIDHRDRTAFSKRVYEGCQQIDCGQTLTYKELAKRSGNEAASRAVGAAMARNRVVLVIPCHRVVSQQGGLRGFSAPGGLDAKRYLLDLETQ